MYDSKCRDDLKPCQISFMKLFTGNFFPQICSIMDVWNGPKYTSEIDT